MLRPPFRYQLAYAPHERRAVSDSRSSRPLAVCPVAAGDRVPQLVVRDRWVLLERLAGRGVDNCVHAHHCAPPSVGLRLTLRARVGTDAHLAMVKDVFPRASAARTMPLRSGSR